MSVSRQNGNREKINFELRTMNFELSNYTNSCRAANWWHLFPTNGDDRAKLTWKNRFTKVLNVGINFYSKGDEVLEIYCEGGLHWWTGLPDTGRYSWHKQELYKGRWGVGSTDWAGWEFAGHWEGSGDDTEWVVNFTEEQANAAQSSVFTTNAVFRHDPDWMFTNSIPQNAQNELLAKAIPALSEATAKHAVSGLKSPGVNNFDLNTMKNGWHDRGYPYNSRWLHSDIKSMAYLYTYKVFDKMVEKGGLK